MFDSPYLIKFVSVVVISYDDVVLVICEVDRVVEVQT